MSLDHDAAVKDLDAVLAALVDIKPMADYGVVGSYDTVQARRQKALAKAEQSLLALRAKLIDATGVQPTRAPLAEWLRRMAGHFIAEGGFQGGAEVADMLRWAEEVEAALGVEVGHGQVSSQNTPDEGIKP